MHTYFDYVMAKPSWAWQLTAARAVCESRIAKAFEGPQLGRVLFTWRTHRDIFDSGRVYKLGFEFEDILEEVGLDVDASNLQPQDWSYVQLNRLYQIDESWWYDSFIYKVSEDAITYMVLLRDRNGYTVHSVGFKLPLEAGKDLVAHPATKDDGAVCTVSPETQGELKRRVCRIALYISSGDPDLRFLKAPTMRKWRSRSKDDTTTCSGVWLVGFSWLKAMLYSVGSSKVRAHLRWQPCGKARSQVRLIIVREHTRTYKNVQDSVGDTASSTESTNWQ